jgi:hypothetical protein
MPPTPLPMDVEMPQLPPDQVGFVFIVIAGSCWVNIVGSYIALTLS